MTTSAHARASGHPVWVPAFAGTSGEGGWRTRMAKVAFLGLGVMGYPMAGHLKAKGGHDVTVYNRTAAKAEAWLSRHGGRRAATPDEAATGQDFVMACVGNDDDLRAVTLGDNGAFGGMK